MAIELKVPAVGESITEVEIGDWLKPEGETVGKDETLATLESDKATVELPSPAAGKLSKILKQKGEMAAVGEVIAYLEAAETAATPPAKPQTKPSPQGTVPPPPPADNERPSPSAQPVRETKPPVTSTPRRDPSLLEPPPPPSTATSDGRQEEVVPMTPLRRAVARHLVEAQQTAALLTTFNEVGMSGVMALRREFQAAFQEKYGVKLGFMSFFVKAVVEALKQVPQVNAEVRGTDIVYRNFYDIGVAVGGGKGLVVPILRNAERLSFAEIETAIGTFGQKAKENRFTPDELQGGTFTISNGGVFGSLLSTPIVNPPQSGILGLHAI